MITRRTSSDPGWHSSVLAYAFALHFLFGSVTVVNAAELYFFYYFPRKIQIAIIDFATDGFVWILSIACLSILAIWCGKNNRRGFALCAMAGLALALIPYLLMNHSKPAIYALYTLATAEFMLVAFHAKLVAGLPKSTFVSRVLVYVLASILAIEISSAIHYALKAFDRFTWIGKLDSEIELQLSYVSYPLLPWLYVGFLFSWAWAPLVERLLLKIGIFRSCLEKPSVEPYKPPARSLLDRISVYLDPRLFLALAVAFFIGYYPYFQNPPWLVGTDAYWRYYDPLLRINERGVTGGFLQALDERHPLSLAIMYLTQLVFRTTAFEVVRLAPLFLVVVLGMLTWLFLARREDTQLSLIVFLLSIFSITTTVGMYSSILANWMALVVWMAFFAYATIRSDKRFGFLDILPLLGLSTLILMFHPWTWGMFASALSVAAIITLAKERRRGLGPAAILISVVAIDVLFAFLSLTILKETQGWRIADSIELYTWVFRDPASLLLFWNALARLTQVWAPFFSPLYLAMSCFGVLCLRAADLTPWRRRLILAWIFASAIGSIMVAPVGYDPNEPTASESQLWRLLFLTPFQLTAPIGMTVISRLGIRLADKKGKTQFTQSSVRPAHRVLLPLVFVFGFLLSWIPAQGRIIIVLLPVVLCIAIRKARRNEVEFFTDTILMSFVVAYSNSTMRGLSQLLIDPHNYTP